MKCFCLLSAYVFDWPVDGVWLCHLGVCGQEHGRSGHLWSSRVPGSRFSYNPGHVSLHDSHTHRGADGRYNSSQFCKGVVAWRN